MPLHDNFTGPYGGALKIRIIFNSVFFQDNQILLIKTTILDNKINK